MPGLVLFFRWAQFFIHPLMIRDAIDREVEAVDSGKISALRFMIISCIELGI